MYGGVSLSQYSSQPLSGFGAGQMSDVQDLQKALEAGYQISGQTGGSALRVESLEGSLKVVTYTANHIKFWKKIPKSAAYSTVEEYNQLTSYGSNAGAFVQEGELPPSQDTTYARRTSLVKYIGVTKEVTHPMTVVHPAHGDVIALENQNGILWLLQRIEDALFHGDSSLAFDGESEQWDGLDALIDPTSFIDLEGDPIQEADIEEAANQLVEQFAYPTDLWLGNRVASDLVKTFYPRERVQLPAPQNGMVGMTINSMMTQAGVIEMNPNVFLRRAPSPSASATSASAPTAPASAVGAVVAAADGDFNKGNPAGTNFFGYAVTAANRFGESAPTFNATNVTITQAEKDGADHITVTITNPGVIGAFQPEYFNIYRTNDMGTAVASTDPADYSLIARIPSASVTGAGVTVFTDVNFILPFMQTAYLGQMTPDVLTMRQLLPMLRMDLAVLSPAYRWLILMYACPLLFAPAKWCRLINIGQLV